MDHGGESGFVQPHTAPGDENIYFRAAVTGGRLGTYVGQDRVGGDTTTQSLLRGDVGDEGRTPEEVAGNSAKGREGCDNDEDDDDNSGEEGE